MACRGIAGKHALNQQIGQLLRMLAQPGIVLLSGAGGSLQLQCCIGNQQGKRPIHISLRATVWKGRHVFSSFFIA